MRNSTGFKVFIYAAAVFVSLIILAPFAWLIISSVAAPADLLTKPLRWIPPHASLSRYSAIFFGANSETVVTFRAALLNSTIVATSSVFISLGVGIFGAYAFARLQFRFQRGILLVFLSTYMLPPIAILISLYLTMVQLHLLDTRLGLILVYCSFITPFVLWIMSGYFRSIPRDLEDAARIDGCSRIGALFRVVLPLARPGLLATALFGFLLAWDEFLYALVFIQDERAITVPVGLNLLIYGDVFHWGELMAASVITTLPVVGLFMFIHRWMVEGLAAGSVKG